MRGGESWRQAWRGGVAPLLSDAQLQVLRDGLAADDSRIIQGQTTEPELDECAARDEPEGACPLAFCLWRADGIATVGGVDSAFHRLCGRIDEAIGQTAGCRHFLNAWDESPRVEAVREVLAEVELALASRRAVNG